jgi:glycosyltransferase involved in cell wall biosynthesis
MNAQPEITIVTPTKNRLPLLRQAMESVRAQSFTLWEHIVVDDGSDDGSIEEVERRCAQDPRVRLIRRDTERKGANVCRNLGLSAARAGLVMFLDSDDRLRPDCLGGRVKAMARNQDLDFAVYPAGVFIERLGDLDRLYHPMTPGDDLLRFLSHECVWEITGPVWRRAFLDRVGGFDEGLLSMQDLELHVRAIVARGRYVFFSEIDHDIRWLDDPTRTSALHFKSKAHMRGNEAMREITAAQLRSSGLMTWSRQRALLGMCFNAAYALVRVGEVGEAMASWRRGCRSAGVSGIVWLEGAILLLAAVHAASHSERVIGKWKGWRRLRPEPVPPNLL